MDAIYCGDSRHMAEVADGAMQLIVTSPPYNVGKAYQSHHDQMALDEYLAYLDEVWRECQRVLCRGGRLAVNVASTWRQPYLPLHAYIAQRLIALGFLMRGEIIWNKGASAGTSTAWGSFARPSNPTLRDVHEYILVFSKETLKLAPTEGGAGGRESGIANLDFVEWTKSIWRFDTESPKRVGHPAPFPEELPRRLILLYTGVGDTVLDPFLGSGTTAVAAKRLGRHYVGYDISEEYCQIARQRLATLPEPLFALPLVEKPARPKKLKLGL